MPNVQAAVGSEHWEYITEFHLMYDGIPRTKCTQINGEKKLSSQNDLF